MDDMFDIDGHKFNWRLQSPKKLEERCIEHIAYALLKLNNKISKCDSTSVCSAFAEIGVNKDSNERYSDVKKLFVDLPTSIIQEIISKMVDVAYDWYGDPDAEDSWLRIRKDVLSILLCKPIRRLELRLENIESNDLEAVFQMIKQTESQLDVLKLKRNIWVEQDPTFPIMQTYLRDMPSLTHLEMKLNCDYSLLETVGGSCPSLKFLRVNSTSFTSGGLKSLCLNPKDLTKRCQKLEVLILVKTHWPPKDDLTDGLAALLLGLPQLALLEYKGFDMSKVFRLVYDNDQQQHTELKIRKITYTHNFCQQLHPVHLPNLCPHLKALTLKNISSDELASFPVMATLREVTLMSIVNKLDFDHGIVHFLKSNGNFLEVLHFEDTQYVNYTTVDQLCENLKEVEFDNVVNLDGSLSLKPVFKKVERFCFSRYIFDDCEYLTQLIRLISKCLNLRQLSIILIGETMGTLTLDHLVDIISRNPLRHLVSIKIKTDLLSIEGKTSDAATPLSSFLHTLHENNDSSLQ